MSSFGAVDYVIFLFSVFLCLCVGIFFASRRRKQNTTDEYLLGNRKLHPLPVALSVSVSYQSAITMVGVPADAYMYGMVTAWIGLCTFLGFLFSTQILVPLIHPLKLTSIYEYFQLRFQSDVPRLYATILGIISTIMYLAIITYGAATAIEAVTPIPFWCSILVSTVIAMIYTAIGGMRAVIWTDVFQILVMTVGTIAVLVKCTQVVGGIDTVFEIAADNGRLNAFRFDSFFHGRTFWTVFIGNFFFALGFTMNQMLSQRVSCVQTERGARFVVAFSGFAMFSFQTLASIVGLFAFAYFQRIKCDPLAGQLITNSNQIVPMMVVQIFTDAPGLPGLYIAALYSATLSTLSSGLNCLSALTIQDLIKPYAKHISEFKTTAIAKIMVAVYGLFVAAVSFMVAHIKGTLIQVAISIISSFSGSVTGMLILAAFFPKANVRGILIGGLVGTSFALWISIGNAFSTTLKKELPLPPASTTHCHAYKTIAIMNSTEDYQILQNTTESTENMASEPDNLGLDKLYSISHLMLQFICILTTVVIGTFVSLSTGPPLPEEVDVNLVLPFLDQYMPCLPFKFRRLFYCGIKFEKRKILNSSVYDSADAPQGQPLSENIKSTDV